MKDKKKTFTPLTKKLVIDYGNHWLVALSITLLIYSIVVNFNMLQLSESGVILSLIGILATFIVLGNISQVIYIKDQTKDSLDRYKEGTDDAMKDINDRITSLEKVHKLITSEANDILQLKLNALKEDLNLCNTADEKSSFLYKLSNTFEYIENDSFWSEITYFYKDYILDNIDKNSEYSYVESVYGYIQNNIFNILKSGISGTLVDSIARLIVQNANRRISFLPPALFTMKFLYVLGKDKDVKQEVIQNFSYIKSKITDEDALKLINIFSDDLKNNNLSYPGYPKDLSEKVEADKKLIKKYNN